MLRTKSQGHRPPISEEEDFKRGLAYMGVAGILLMLPKYFEYILANLSQGVVTWTFNILMGLQCSDLSWKVKVNLDLWNFLPEFRHIRWCIGLWVKNI